MAKDKKARRPTNGEEAEEAVTIGPEALREKPVKVKVIDRRFWAKKHQSPDEIEGNATAFDEKSLYPSYVQELEAKYSDTLARLQELSDAFRALKAEQDNFRRRVEKQKEHLIFEFKKRLFNQLLEVLDNFERALHASARSESTEAIITGLEMILGQFERVLEQEGVEKVAPVGEPYDPSEAEVVEVVETEDPALDHRIADVIQPGYRIGDLLLRPARVRVYQVAQPPGSGFTKTSPETPPESSAAESIPEKKEEEE